MRIMWPHHLTSVACCVTCNWPKTRCGRSELIESAPSPSLCHMTALPFPHHYVWSQPRFLGFLTEAAANRLEMFHQPASTGDRLTLASISAFLHLPGSQINAWICLENGAVCAHSLAGRRTLTLYAYERPMAQWCPRFCTILEALKRL